MAVQEAQTISAIYKNGVLRPLEPLALPEDTRVQVTIAVTKDNDQMSDEELRTILVAGGVQLVPRPTHRRQPLTEEARAALRREIGPGVNASQAIIEERETQL